MKTVTAADPSKATDITADPSKATNITDDPSKATDVTADPCKATDVTAEVYRTQTPIHYQTLSYDSRTKHSVAVGADPTDFDFIGGQCHVFNENSACRIPSRHKTLTEGDVKLSIQVHWPYMTTSKIFGT